ncbi:AdoMet dependent proline di-methyltransferase-domain-containing protein [Crepidotus variabilis]|uniref:Alpha N-terminal protein methyltransferase 1 n=1 Tax=Crepidotus variabilis TaxID=179855 RepID=A0A9P6EV62_9AGAR|nr:AdoMet dependent proline di-methyltransferase-domain-containing protein [Crepidotus variabilis]
MPVSASPQVSLPVVEDGIEYWKTQPASLDGVLGGYGTGSLPRIDALGSRLFLLNLYPELSTLQSSFKPLYKPLQRRTRALDVGAGIGRVTADVLLHLVSDVILVEPVEPFIKEALQRARNSASESPEGDATKVSWPGLASRTKSVTLLQETLQAFLPLLPHRAEVFHDRVGYQITNPASDIISAAIAGTGGVRYDIIWCQWCLGHLSNPDLVAFLKRCKEALNQEDEVGRKRSLIGVKENLCYDGANGEPLEIFDEEDSSLTRSDAAWKKLFNDAGLRLVREQIQEGLPEGIYVVKMYALR